MKKITLLSLIVCLCGCAAELTQEGRMVRQIQPDWGTKCKFLGVVEASEADVLDVADDKIGALNGVRNKVAQAGGNAFVISQSASDDFGTLVQADAYSCPETK